MYRKNNILLDNILAASAVLIVVLLYRVHASHLCVHFVLCPIPLLEVEGSAPVPLLGEGMKLVCIVHTDLIQPVSSCLLN